MESIRWDGQTLHLLDQRQLPAATVWLPITDSDGAAAAIRDMVVRGAPAIAITAAYGLALAVARGESRPAAAARLMAARPTAVNLRWALAALAPLPDAALTAAAVALHHDDLRVNRALGGHGALLLDGGVLTICNTGSLATGGYGTALGMVRAAREAGRAVHLYALETRPYLQGARLTATECLADGIPCTLLTDGMAGALLASGRVQAAVVGCDRVANNGDTANKIGTYGLAVLCRYHQVPFYVAMPTSTLDRQAADGAAIPIEQRDPAEVTHVLGQAIAPSGAQAWNPAFDVTPASLVTAWVTERGVWHPPFPLADSTTPWLTA